jgi:hypothetical protein
MTYDTGSRGTGDRHPPHPPDATAPPRATDAARRTNTRAAVIHIPLLMLAAFLLSAVWLVAWEARERGRCPHCRARMLVTGWLRVPSGGGATFLGCPACGIVVRRAGSPPPQDDAPWRDEDEGRAEPRVGT